MPITIQYTMQNTKTLKTYAQDQVDMMSHMPGHLGHGQHVPPD